MINLDFETYSEAGLVCDGQKWRSPRYDPDDPKSSAKNKGLPLVGAAVYAFHPSTEILTFAYEIDGDGLAPRVWVPGSPIPADLLEAVRRGDLIKAANSFFEFLIWNVVGTRQLGLPPVPIDRFRCTLAAARAFNLPPSLGKLAEVLKLAEQKDKGGKRMIDLFCVPQPITAKNKQTKLDPLTHPEGVGLYTYCMQDVATEKAVGEVVPELSPRELEIFLFDQRVNARGVQVDTPSIEALSRVYKLELDRQTARLREITGGRVHSVGQVKEIREFLDQAYGIKMASVDAEHVADALKVIPADHPAAEVLRIRADAGSSNAKKLLAFNERACPDGRVRGMTVYSKANTGRWAGEGVQPQNMASGGPKVVRSNCCGSIRSAALAGCPYCPIGDPGYTKADWGPEGVDRVVADALSGAIFKNWPSVIEAITGCLRGLFIAAPGCELISSDYSAIEAVVLACLAGEQWRIDVFRTHGKIYEMSAAKISGVPFDEIIDHKKRTGDHHPLRKTVGKVAELASGYGGWIGAWKNFGADAFMTDDEIKKAVLKWREESPAIVEFWGGQWRRGPGGWGDWAPELYGLEGMAISAVMTPGRWFWCRSIGYYSTGSALFCRLPSGRDIVYHEPRVDPSVDPLGRSVWALSYMGWNSDSSKGPVGWLRQSVYGGLLAENVTQAVARDIMANGLLNLERAGYYVVFHVHDEAVAEVPAGFGSVDQFEACLTDLPAWCKDWPIRAAGGWRGRRYRKE